MECKNRRHEQIAAVGLFSFSLFYFLSSWRMKPGTIRNPGPGFIPLIVGFLLLLCTAAYLIRVWRQEIRMVDEDATVPQGEKNYRAIFGILGCTLAYPFLLEYAKFIVSTLAATYVMLVLLKPSFSLWTFVLAVGLAVGSFVVFSVLLGVALPSGFLEDWMFRIGR